jgi:hypothetical protein
MGGSGAARANAPTRDSLAAVIKPRRRGRWRRPAIAEEPTITVRITEDAAYPTDHQRIPVITRPARRARQRLSMKASARRIAGVVVVTSSPRARRRRYSRTRDVLGQPSRERAVVVDRRSPPPGPLRCKLIDDPAPPPVAAAL